MSEIIIIIIIIIIQQRCNKKDIYHYFCGDDATTLKPDAFVQHFDIPIYETGFPFVF